MDDQNEQSVVALDQALLQALADPAAEPAFRHRLLHSNLYVLGHIEDAQIEEDGTVWPRHSSTLRITHFDVDGETVLPVFSAPDHLQSLFDEVPDLILLRATNLFASATPDVKIVLNPGTAVGRAFTYEDIQKLLR
ncbi:type III secretion system (T3SS) SseB-like protein [Tumebacillus sp. BK434]|uniref:SseB family protein n=1 Tax=Tumebacillus sp. BK434 TaxID=2512169 RepID=UPI0010504676|nr:SseB family protein [Tumebacillus sp. BK434]TCP58966.1 type III secretion system (T3SS) SseB-like protein [Tumebacillus sp. BK434]